MNKLILLSLLFILNSTAIYSQKEIPNDSIRYRNILQEADPYTNLLEGPIDLSPENNRLNDITNITSKSYLNYQLRNNFSLKPYNTTQNQFYKFYGLGYDYGVGKFYEGGVGVFFKPFDRLTISAGMSAVQYNILQSRYNDVVFYFNATYKFNNWLKLTEFVQYSLKARNNAHYGGYMFSPQTSYGAILKIKASDKVDFDMGVERLFNTLNKSWETKGIFGPSIRLR